MTTISSISELLSLSGSQFRVYDLGRKIDKISKDTFNKIELNQLPYPYPTQANACLAIVFWQKNSQQPFIWFIKLPLDERGLLNQGARNHYIAIIIEALGNNITDTPSEKQEELLKNNPYHFTPAQYKLAALNSIVNTELKREMSEHHGLFTQYISGDLGWDNWQNIGVQGINDFASKINESNNAQQLTRSFNLLPDEVINPLCTALENQKLPLGLIEAILNKLQQANLDENTKSNLLRGLSSSSSHPLVVTYINSLLKQDESLSVNTLILFAGRLWDVFDNTEILLSYLEAIAKHDDVELFTEIFKDLVAIPSLRPKVFEVMRAPERSDALSRAIGYIFQTTNKG
ncbi:DUF3549 family protein [Pseudocolwellia sp. HL-MZ19]|uniref:DUF3549 family protein n=1 Tax=unclassified Pseudocolwellia TaxID=2848178 RepID=UPI003CEC6805